MKTTTDIPTPRTDNLVWYEERELEDFARELERELAQATSALKDARECIGKVYGQTCIHHTDAQRTEAGCPVCQSAARLAAEGACGEMRAFLERWAQSHGCDCEYPEHACDCGAAEFEQAKQRALSTTLGQGWLSPEDGAKLQAFNDKLKVEAGNNEDTITDLTAELAASQQRAERLETELATLKKQYMLEDYELTPPPAPVPVEVSLELMIGSDVALGEPTTHGGPC